MIDYATEMRQQFITDKRTHEQKLADAIRYLRRHNLYCLDVGSRHYNPAYGSPMPFKRSQS
jgi:hypothetical protein